MVTEAEPLLLSSHERLAELNDDTHPNTVLAAKRIVELYEASGRSEDAARWRPSAGSD